MFTKNMKLSLKVNKYKPHFEYSELIHPWNFHFINSSYNETYNNSNDDGNFDD